MKPGDTFLILAEAPKRHLWVILSDPGVNPMQVVFVSVTSWTAKQDQTCIIDAGEHPFIQHRSCVAYRMARCETLSRLEALERRHGIQRKEPLSPVLLRRVLYGARDSDFTILYHRRILAEQGLIESDDE